MLTVVAGAAEDDEGSPVGRLVAPQQVALVRAGARFENGKLIERPDEHPQPEAA